MVWAQTMTDRMTADLLPLRDTLVSANPSPPNVKLTFPGVVSADLTYKLTASLAGRNLTEENVTPLAAAIVDSLGSALECRNDETPLADCKGLHRSSEQFWTALQNLGL